MRAHQKIIRWLAIPAAITALFLVAAISGTSNYVITASHADGYYSNRGAMVGITQMISETENIVIIGIEKMSHRISHTIKVLMARMCLMGIISSRMNQIGKTTKMTIGTTDLDKKKKPTGFVAVCQCGVVVGAMDFARTDRSEAASCLEYGCMTDA